MNEKTEQEMSDELNGAVLHMYQAMREYLPDLPDLKNYKGIYLRPEVNIDFTEKDVPTVSVELMLVPGNDDRGMLNGKRLGE